MEKLIDLHFNPKPARVMHVDLNSCFASIEQQANPLLRGKPVAVAAYTSPAGCIIAPSVEAKAVGVKVGMRVREGRSIYPNLIVLAPDPNKYRVVHQQFKKILSDYTWDLTPKSIDEFVLNLENSPVLRRMTPVLIGQQIKDRIKKEVGDFLRVSVGIGPNRWLAKTAAGLKKPDGLEIVDIGNFARIYSQLALTDLCGIKTNNVIRLNRLGVFSVADFYQAKAATLKAAFGSVVGYYWYLRLRGYEVDSALPARRSYGNSYALPKPLSRPDELSPILAKLVEKMGARMRTAGWRARGVHLAVAFRDGDWWHKGQVQPEVVFDSREIYKVIMHLLTRCPVQKPVRTLMVSCFDLVKAQGLQLTLLSDLDKKERLVRAVDEINCRWGSFVISPAVMMGTSGNVPDRIAFGGIKELEEMVIN